MKKDRLFVFGDSWAYNYFSDKDKTNLNYKLHFGSECIKKYASLHNYFGHWIDHMENFYDVYSYGFGAASNEQIIYQLGNLPDYKDGDRMLIIFSSPERFIWYESNKEKTIVSSALIENILTMETIPNICKEFLQKQLVHRSDMWYNSEKRLNEKKFINRLPVVYSKWSPLIVSWVTETSDMVDSIIPTPDIQSFSTIYDETNGLCKDFHLGIRGNYDLFKFFAIKLNLNISDYIYDIKTYNFNSII